MTGSKFGEMLLAQELLDPLPETRVRLFQGLASKIATTRILSAQWLLRLNDANLAPVLLKLLKQEKNDAVRDVWMRSLEKLGVSVEEFLDRSGLLQEAQAWLKKGLPGALCWFRADQLPQLHWQDTGECVEPEIVMGWLVQTHKQKNVEPSPLLRRYLNHICPDERKLLGQCVLEFWLGQDTWPKYTQAKAAELAKYDAAQQWSNQQQWLAQTQTTVEAIFQELWVDHQKRTAKYIADYPGYPYDEKTSKENVQRHAESIWQRRLGIEKQTEDHLYQQYLRSYLAELKGSAISDKGILAIAAACCGTAAVPVIQNYLKTYYGMRLSQCLALLQVLAWIEDFSAIQVLLSVANRFRTKRIQDEADKLVQWIAERQGWTKDELADRTIPWVGFSDREQMILDYGNRQFIGHLDGQFNLILSDEKGKTIKALPNARKDEDADLVKSAKRQFSEAKKELKQVLLLQKERLYEAMCTQRSWVFQDWRAFLAQHPVVGRYCQQLVWMVVVQEGGTFEVQQTFRPLGDGSLTDVEDNEVAVADLAIICLAHGSLLSEPMGQAWRSHFTDYEVVPLFDQWGRGLHHLPAEKAHDLELNDFEGYLIDAFQLRGLVTKLGYTRGSAGDGGWFYSYCKRFAGLGLEVDLGFSGNYLPEENRTVALTRLAFNRLIDNPSQLYYGYDARVALDEIPRVLLSETYGDWQVIAAQGSGYDPEWEKKTSY